MQNLFVVIFLCVLSGCNGVLTTKDWANSWIQVNLDTLKKAEKNESGDPFVQKWRDDNTNIDYYLPNGNLIHISPTNRGCFIYWEVDKNTNKLIAYKLEGSRCF